MILNKENYIDQIEADYNMELQNIERKSIQEESKISKQILLSRESNIRIIPVFEP